MTIEELEKRIEKRLESAEKQVLALQHDIQKFTAKLAEAQDEPEIPDYPVYSHEPLYFVHYRSAIIGDENNICNGVMRGDFNAFHTKEYAQEYADKCKLIAMMLHCKWHIDRGYVPDWDDIREIKWDVRFDSEKNKFVCDSWTHTSTAGVYFSSEATAKKCAEWMNEHWRDSE